MRRGLDRMDCGCDPEQFGLSALAIRLDPPVRPGLAGHPGPNPRGRPGRWICVPHRRCHSWAWRLAGSYRFAIPNHHDGRSGQARSRSRGVPPGRIVLWPDNRATNHTNPRGSIRADWRDSSVSCSMRFTVRASAYKFLIHQPVAREYQGKAAAGKVGGKRLALKVPVS